jgi:hypothetical protein
MADPFLAEVDASLAFAVSPEHAAAELRFRGS